MPSIASLMGKMARRRRAARPPHSRSSRIATVGAQLQEVIVTIAPNSKPNPADPLSNPSPTLNLVPPDAPCEPLPNEPPVVQTPGAPTPVHPPAGPDHPFGPPEPIERQSSIFAASDFY